MVGVTPDKVISEISPKKYYMFVKTPQSSKFLLNFAEKCIEANLNPHSNDKMILWVSLSNLDFLCHFFGPDSLESIDLDISFG